jgi:hypothetical protein
MMRIHRLRRRFVFRVGTGHTETAISTYRGDPTMPYAKNHGMEERRTRDEQDLSCDTEARSPEGCAYTSRLAADHARVTQALRDVRHLLPPEGVAIVDEALTGQRFSDEAPLFESSVESAWTRTFN